MTSRTNNAGQSPSRDRCLSEDAIRSILISLIAEHQLSPSNNSLFSDRHVILSVIKDKGTDEVGSIRINEDELGLDSLSRLDLIHRVSQFFCLYESGVDDYLLIRPRICDWVSLIASHIQRMGDSFCLTFETSGTSGKPKRIKKSVKLLQEEVVSFLSSAEPAISRTSRIISLVAPHHVYGFIFSCLLPSVLGIKSVNLHQRPFLGLAEKTRPGDLIIATPLIWHRLSRDGSVFAKGVNGVTSSAPSTEETWSVQHLNGLKMLIDVYGATETAGLGVRYRYKDPFELLSHLSRKDGAIFHASNEAAALPVQDHLAWLGKRQFIVNGRIDDVVQISGNNVSLGMVKDILADVEGVRTLKVSLKGERLTAAVEPLSGMDGAYLSDQLRARARAFLPPSVGLIELSMSAPAAGEGYRSHPRPASDTI